MRLILDEPNVRAILVNIFGGITRGDEVATGLIEARAQQERDVPMVVRIVGTNAAEAAVLLREARFETAALARRGGRQGGRGSARERPREHPRRSRHAALVVQGITGREGAFHGAAMQAYGTQVVAGLTPGKGGQTALDGTVPVFDTVVDAVRETGAEHVVHLRARGRRAGRDPRGRRGRDRAPSSASPRASRRST